MWAHLRWITAAVPQNPTALKSSWGWEGTSAAKKNLKYQNSNKVFTLGNTYFFKVRAIHHCRTADTKEMTDVLWLGCINLNCGHPCKNVTTGYGSKCWSYRREVPARLVHMNSVSCQDVQFPLVPSLSRRSRNHPTKKYQNLTYHP